MQPTPVTWPRELHGLYCSWGRKESGKTEQLSLSSLTDSAVPPIGVAVPRDL